MRIGPAVSMPNWAPFTHRDQGRFAILPTPGRVRIPLPQGFCGDGPVGDGARVSKFRLSASLRPERRGRAERRRRTAETGWSRAYSANIARMKDPGDAVPHSPDFNRERLVWIREVERTHFWHAPRQQLFLDVIQRVLPAGARVLDAGCGTGALCEALSRRGYDVRGVDPHASAMDLDPERFCEATTDSLPEPEYYFDLVCCLDVLEHVDDSAALAEVYRVLKPGGVLLASVPAYQWLWSERDKVAGHLRRYTRAGIRALLEDSGFSVELMFGYQFFLLPALVASRLWQWLRPATVQVAREDRPARLVNAILRVINSAEVRLGSVVRPPVGSSLVMLARKPGR